MSHLRYLEQRALDTQVAQLERECSELRWSLSESTDYDAEIARLKEQKAALQKRVDEEAA